MRPKSRPRRKALVAAALAAACTLSCGYGTTSKTAKDIKSIHVPFFENETAEPNLEISVTERVIENLVSDNTLKVVPEDGADAILDGRIVEFTNKPFSFNQDLNAEEYIVVIRVTATLFNRRTNEPIWQDKSFQGDGSYFIEQVADGRTFDDAVQESLREITERILNLTVQDW
ncbi:MAG TPA: LptE family protein [Candidatus Krumholzibacteria bacterium]|nr:LptE family protein [Candidatus Krumholzibacteria bacterium]